MAAEWYWHDGTAWIAYEPAAGDRLENAKAAGWSSASVTIGSQLYEIDFVRKVQRNSATGFERAVWQGPNPPLMVPPIAQPQPLAFAPAASTAVPATSLQAALKCAAWPLATAADGLPNFWGCRPTGGLYRIERGSPEASQVIGRWTLQAPCAIAPNRITSICRVEHNERWLRYQRRKQELCQEIPDHSPEGGVKELHLFHGSRRESIHSILEGPEGIDASRCTRGVFGKGAYFASSHATSDGFAQSDAKGEKHIILCRVLVGRMRLGSQDIAQKPADCDTTVNSNLAIFCKFDNREKYEEYVISYI